MLRFLTLQKLGRTLRTTLVEHGFHYIADLQDFFVVRLLKLDAETQQYLAPKTKVQPVDPTAGASASPRLWDDFMSKRFGDDNHNPLAVIKESELASILSDETLHDAGTTLRKAEMVNQWVQGGSLDVLNPFTPIQDGSSAEVSSNGKTGGSTTSSALGDMSRYVASSSFEAQDTSKPPSPRKRFGKVRKPKGAKIAESLELKDTLLEDSAKASVTNQVARPSEELQPDPGTVEKILSGTNEAKESVPAREPHGEIGPDTDPKVSQTIHKPPEILPPQNSPSFSSSATGDILQDEASGQPPTWEKQHAHAAVVGCLVDVTAPTDNSQDVKAPPGYKPSLIRTRPRSSSQQLVNLLDVSEEEYPALGPPSSSADLTTQPSLMDPPILPLRTTTRTLRIVKHQGTVPDSSSTADSVTSKAKPGKPLKETLQGSDEVESRKFKHTMGQQKPAPRKEKIRNDNAAKEIRGSKADKADLRKLNNTFESVLESALYFRGEVKLEVQIGRILMKSVPNQHRKMPFTIEDWFAIFATRNVSEIPVTTFTNMYAFCMTFGIHILKSHRRLTTSSRDAVFIRDLIAPGAERMFDEQRSGYKITYSFICLTKEGDEM